MSSLLLPGLAVPVLLAVALGLFLRRWRQVRRRLADARLLPAIGGPALAARPTARLAAVLLAGTVLGGAIAISAGVNAEAERRALGGPVVFVVDVSISMLAEDLSPSRLALARAQLAALAESLDQVPVGIVAFAGRAFALTPPTLDRGAVDLYLDTLDPSMVTQTGSSIAAGLRQAASLLLAGESETGSIVLVSDGDTPESVDSVLAVARLARRAGIPIHTLTVPAGEAAVPRIDLTTGEVSGYIRDASGQPTVTRADPALLREISGMTGGLSAPIGAAAGSERLAATLRGGAIAPDADARRGGGGYWVGLTALALLLLLLEPWLTVRMIRRRFGAAVPVVVLVLIAGCARQGEPGDGDAALARYNLGTALLLAGRYEQARPPLEAAASAADSLVALRARYNAGNADLEPAVEADTLADAAAVRRAIEAYKSALRLDPTDLDSKWNLEIARRLLRELPSSPPPPPDPAAGGGGGGGGGEGGAGGGAPQPGRQDPSPRAAGPGGAQPELDREAAERLLEEAEERELGVQRDVLRKPQPPRVGH